MQEIMQVIHTERPHLQSAKKEIYNLGGIHTVVYKPDLPNEQIPLGGFRPVMIEPGVWCTSEHYMVLDLADVLLSQGQAVVSFDHKGLADPSIGGQTPGKPKDYHMKQMVADLITVRNKLQEIPDIAAYRTTGLGISIGGATMAYAARAQTATGKSPLFEDLVLISPFVDMQSTSRYFSKFLHQDSKGLYMTPSTGGRKHITMDVFERGAQKYRGVTRELLSDLRNQTGLIFGEEDPQFSAMQVMQSLPIDSISLEKYWLSLNDKRENIRFDKTGVASKIITIDQPRQYHVVGQAYLIRGGNHNLNNKPETIAARNKIILSTLSPTMVHWL